MHSYAVITQVTSGGILLEGDYGEQFKSNRNYVVGEPRVGATATLVPRSSEEGGFRVFIHPVEQPARISSDPDESGVQLVGRFAEEPISHTA